MRVRRDRRGVVAIEAAIALALVVVPTVLTLFDLGGVLETRLRVDRALQAGMFAAWAISGATAGQITQAAAAGAGNTSAGPSVSATASFSYLCLAPTGTYGSGSPASAGTACPSGQVLGEWVTIATSAAVSLPFPLPGVASPMTLTATGRTRIQ
jgi:Flp pilus assembly protein TadG